MNDRLIPVFKVLDAANSRSADPRLLQAIEALKGIPYDPDWSYAGFDGRGLPKPPKTAWDAMQSNNFITGAPTSKLHLGLKDEPIGLSTYRASPVDKLGREHTNEFGAVALAPRSYLFTKDFIDLLKERVNKGHVTWTTSLSNKHARDQYNKIVKRFKTPQDIWGDLSASTRRQLNLDIGPDDKDHDARDLMRAAYDSTHDFATSSAELAERINAMSNNPYRTADMLETARRIDPVFTDRAIADGQHVLDILYAIAPEEYQRFRLELDEDARRGMARDYMWSLQGTDPQAQGYPEGVTFRPHMLSRREFMRSPEGSTGQPYSQYVADFYVANNTDDDDDEVYKRYAREIGDDPAIQTRWVIPQQDTTGMDFSDEELKNIYGMPSDGSSNDIERIKHKLFQAAQGYPRRTAYDQVLAEAEANGLDENEAAEIAQDVIDMLDHKGNRGGRSTRLGKPNKDPVKAYYSAIRNR